MNINLLLYKSKLLLKKSTPTILSLVSVAGVVTTTVLAIKATPKALRIIEDKKVERANDTMSLPIEPLTKTEVVKLTWKCYVPTAIVGVSTVSCIFLNNMLNKKKQASLAGGYYLIKESFDKYREASKDVYGDDADFRITAQAAKNKYVSNDGSLLYDPSLDTSSDDLLFYDDYSKRYFTSSVTAVLNAQYHINRNLSLRGYVSVNEFYEFLGIDEIDTGDDFGWCAFDLAEDGLMWLDFDNRPVVIDDGLECYVITTILSPSYLEF